MGCRRAGAWGLAFCSGAGGEKAGRAAATGSPAQGFSGQAPSCCPAPASQEFAAPSSSRGGAPRRCGAMPGSLWLGGPSPPRPLLPFRSRKNLWKARRACAAPSLISWSSSAQHRVRSPISCPRNGRGFLQKKDLLLSPQGKSCGREDGAVARALEGSALCCAPWRPSLRQPSQGEQRAGQKPRGGREAGRAARAGPAKRFCALGRSWLPEKRHGREQLPEGRAKMVAQG